MMENLNLNDVVISFKSDERYFDVEESGKKNNTVRFIDWNDDRFQTLLLMKNSGKFGVIEITSKVNPDCSFKRKIEDISIFDNLMIITWDHTKVYQVSPCWNAKFEGIDCLEDETRYGFFKSNNDVRPGHAIWIEKDKINFIYKMLEVIFKDESMQ